MTEVKIAVNLDYDIVIAGGGVAGLTLACALKNSGLKIAIIEPQPQEIARQKKQAYAVSLLSGKIFEGIGVWGKISPNIAKFTQIRLSDADYPTVVQFSPQDLGTQHLGYVAEHRSLATPLQDFLADAANVTWLCPGQVTGVEYEDSQAQINVDIQGETKIIGAKLLVGADGAKSPIRNWAGIKTKGWKYWQSCVAFTIKHSAPSNDIAFERFWHTGPMGVLPLPGNRCQIVWTNPHAQAKALQELGKEEFLAKVAEHTGGLLGNLELVSDRMVFPVQLMQCDRYIQRRLALIGDAAHCCHPVGGQGLNLGIRDAAALAQVLQKAHQQGEDIGNITVLKRYEGWRKIENLGILVFTDFLDRFFSTTWLPIVASRRLGLWLMKYIPPLKIFALQLMTGLKGKQPDLAQL